MINAAVRCWHHNEFEQIFRVGNSFTGCFLFVQKTANCDSAKLPAKTELFWYVRKIPNASTPEQKTEETRPWKGHLTSRINVALLAGRKLQGLHPKIKRRGKFTLTRLPGLQDPHIHSCAPNAERWGHYMWINCDTDINEGKLAVLIPTLSRCHGDN